jgi:hypothetical protein
MAQDDKKKDEKPRVYTHHTFDEPRSYEAYNDFLNRPGRPSDEYADLSGTHRSNPPRDINLPVEKKPEKKKTYRQAIVDKLGGVGD